jgi:hypothetical protein
MTSLSTLRRGASLSDSIVTPATESATAGAGNKAYAASSRCSYPQLYPLGDPPKKGAWTW